MADFNSYVELQNYSVQAILKERTKLLAESWARLEFRWMRVHFVTALAAAFAVKIPQSLEFPCDKYIVHKDNPERDRRAEN